MLTLTIHLLSVKAEVLLSVKHETDIKTLYRHRDADINETLPTVSLFIDTEG
jgi:hypothetical protein